MRVELSAWTFHLVGLRALAIPWLTVGYQLFKSALIDPVRVPRHE